MTATTDVTTTDADLINPAEWDFERGMTTIRNQRQENRGLIKENGGLRGAIQALAGGRPLSPVAQALVDSAIPSASQPTNDLAAVAAILGVDASDPAAVVDAAKQSRLSAELGELLHKNNLDLSLSRAAINQERLLAEIDVTADDLHAQLDGIVTKLVERHPQLRLGHQGPSISGLPFPAGSGGSPTQITREALSWMTPQAVADARAAGILEHLNVGRDA